MEDNTFKAAKHISGYLSNGTRRAFAAKPSDDAENEAGAGERPLDHHKLEAVRKHVFDGTTTHKEAHDRMKSLIAVHKGLYDNNQQGG